jgi:glyoxylase-like metal-dependent hydrolase (beta-lactamase superfamily II)
MSLMKSCNCCMKDGMEKAIRIEDNFEDVLGKAASGLGLKGKDLSEAAGVPLARLQALLAGEFNEADAGKVAEALNLDGDALIGLARGDWRPEPVVMEGLLAYNTPFPVPGYAEMTVNSYITFDPDSLTAAVFDTGASIDGMLADIKRLGLKVELILLTHTHHDHIHALDSLIQATGNPPVWVNEREALSRALTFTEGKTFSVGRLKIESRLTHGHSPGGTTYVIRGLQRPVAVVGDSLFCCSQGGAPSAYKQALDNNRGKILSLPDETVICPGHGPMTSVGEEKIHNPFFANPQTS